MIYYLDTSLLIAVYAAEHGHERLAEWMYVRATRQMAASGWTRTEFASALSLKLRTKQIDTASRDKAGYSFESAMAETFVVFPILAADFDTAARWCERQETGLRAGDALHLAIASRNNATLCTLDRTLHEAGQFLLVQTLLV